MARTNTNSGGGGGSGPFSNITGAPNRFAWFDASGNGTTDANHIIDATGKMKMVSTFGNVTADYEQSGAFFGQFPFWGAFGQDSNSGSILAAGIIDATNVPDLGGDISHIIFASGASSQTISGVTAAGFSVNYSDATNNASYSINSDGASIYYDNGTLGGGFQASPTGARIASIEIPGGGYTYDIINGSFNTTVNGATTRFNSGKTYAIQSQSVATFSSITFTGSGLNDLSISGTYLGSSTGTYDVLAVGPDGARLFYGSMNTGNFSQGDTVTGSISGATATIQEKSNSRVWVYNTVGTFVNGDILTNSLGAVSSPVSSINTGGDLFQLTFNDGNGPQVQWFLGISSPWNSIAGTVLTFASPSGHTSGDTWTFTASPTFVDVASADYNHFSINQSLTLSTFSPLSNSTITIDTSAVIWAIDTTISSTVLLPATAKLGEMYIIKDLTGTASINGLNIDGNGNTIDGQNTQSYTADYTSVQVVWNGTEWSVTDKLRVPVLTDGVTVVGDGDSIPLSSNFTQSGKYLLSGGISWSGTGYTYDVSVLKYVFDGVYYGPTTPTQVTMAAADPTDNRFDAVVVDILGNITVITGTPSANPALPTIPDDQLVVGYVLVEAGTTQPTILQDTIYLDNAEWTTSTYTTGIGSSGTINFNSTNTPKQGAKCVGLVTNPRLGAKFTRATAIDSQQFAFLQIWYRNDTTLLNTKAPTVRFDNSLGNPVGNTVNLLNYGISRTIVGTWQLAIIPISAFGAITTVKGLRAIITGGTLAQQAQWSLDFMLLSGGILPQGALGPIFLSPSNTLYSTGAATGATAVQNSQFFGNLAGFQATAASNSIFEGYGSGYAAQNANDSIFLGNKSGFKASNANNSIFEGTQSGYGATNADNSQFIGTRSGFNASSAYSSTFIGANAGENATNAYQSVFIGRDSGLNATNADDSFFLGYQSGSGATNASTSAFLGTSSGAGATSASSSVFLGYNSGNGAALAANSIFIGTNAGLGDTVDNTSGGTSTVIGYQSTTGGFSNSIMLGTLGANTAANQFMVGSNSVPVTDVLLGDHTNAVNGDMLHIDGANDRIDMKAHGENRSAMVGKIIPLTDNTTTSVFEITLPAGGMTGGFFSANVTATDGTNFQAHSDQVSYAAVNKGGVYTTTITPSNADDAVATSAGTLAVTWSITTGTDKIIVRVNANSSLTAPTIKLRLNIMNNGGQAITIL